MVPRTTRPNGGLQQFAGRIRGAHEGKPSSQTGRSLPRIIDGAEKVGGGGKAGGTSGKRGSAGKQSAARTGKGGGGKAGGNIGSEEEEFWEDIFARPIVKYGVTLFTLMSMISLIPFYSINIMFIQNKHYK